LNDKKHGYGIYEQSDGKIYEGNWLDGRQHGYGTFYLDQSKTKVKYGNWNEGRRMNWVEVRSSDFDKPINFDSDIAMVQE